MDYYQQASNFVEGVDWAFYFIFGIGLFFLIAITLVMLYFVIRYRRNKHPQAIQVKEKAWLELTWFVVPLILVIFMFYFGYVAYSPMRDAPKDAMLVKTTGKMWEWSFEYPNGKVTSELTLPINKPVKLELTSLDVIHGFAVPAYRIKQDVVPGQTNTIWFVPQEYGEFEIFCSAYCGLKHSFMESKVVVISDSLFASWYSVVPTKTIDHEGLAVIKMNACTGCHSIDGAKGVGPTFKGLYGSSKTIDAGGNDKTITVDDLYIRRSIYTPDADIVKGFPKGVMKSYKGVVKNEEVKKIIEYLKTI